MPMPEKAPAFSRTTRIALKLALVLLVLAVAVYLLVVADLQRALNSRFDRLAAIGVPTTWAKAAPPPIPDSENAAIIYEQAFAELKGLISDTELSDRQALTHFVSDNPPGNRAKLRSRVLQILARNQRAIRLIKEGSARPRCRFSLDWNESPVEMTFPTFPALRMSARLLAAEAIIAAERGDGKRVVEDYHVGIRLCAHAAETPTLISFLVSVTSQQILLTPLPEVLAQGGLNDADCRALYEDLQRLDFNLPLREALALHGCEALWCFDAADRTPDKFRELFGADDQVPRVYLALYSSPLFKPLRLKEEIAYTELLERELAAAAKPYRESVSERDSLNEEVDRMPGYYVTTQIVGHVFVRTAASRDRAIALRNAMQVALALRAYHVERGQYPDSLAALRKHPGWELPGDPFSGKPFVYHRQGAGYLLYSFGPDLDDDGGKPYDNLTQNGDLVWECRQ